MRVVVVGSGIIGLLTAVDCARSGASVDVIDQAAIPAPAATSNDRQRVVRALHRGDAPVTRAAAGLPAAWTAIDRWLCERTYRRTGVLTLGDPAETKAHLDLLARTGVRARTRSAAEIAALYPRLRLTAGLEGVFEPQAGVVLADRVLAALADRLRELPEVRLHPHRRVLAVEPAARTVRCADGSRITGDGIVVAAGPWSRELLPPAVGAALTLRRQTVLSYQPISNRGSWSGMPAVIGLGEPRDAWLIPSVAGAPVRLSAASACRPATRIAGTAAPDEHRDRLVERFGTLLSEFDRGAVTDARDGYYLEDAETGGPLLAQLSDGAVWAYAACGGMSFKFAPPIAHALADRAMGRSPRPTGLAALDRPRPAPGPTRHARSLATVEEKP